jgi:TPR repeat protein
MGFRNCIPTIIATSLATLLSGAASATPPQSEPQGPAVDVDTTEALAAYVSACNQDSPRDCALAARMYLQGRTVKADPERALDCFEKGCRLGDGAQCNAAAGQSDDLTSSKSLALFEKGCELGHLKSCENAATYLYMQALEMMDQGLARRAFRHASRMCAENGPASEPFCKQVADCLIDGFGVRADEATGERLLKEQCRRNPGQGACADLGDRYLSGDGVRPSVVEARNVLDAGCQGGDTGSCSVMARL